MYLLLPLTDNSGKRFPKAQIEDLSEDFAWSFHGTAYLRCPPRGSGATGAAIPDDIVIFEVMVEQLDLDRLAPAT